MFNSRRLHHIGSFGEIAKVFKIETLYLPIGMDADTESLTTLQEAIEAGKILNEDYLAQI